MSNRLLSGSACKGQAHLRTTEVRKLVLQPPIGARTVPCRIRTCNVATIELDGLRTSTTRSGSLFPQSKLSVATKAATLESPQATSNDIDSELLANIRKAALHLREHGWAVVEGVLPPDRCESAISAAWDWLESLGTGIKRTDPTTWDASRWPPGNFGIISTLEVAHQGFVWDVRKHPRVVKVFEELWGTNELLTSFDSINVLRPREYGTSKMKADYQKPWWHVDQAPTRLGMHCIQGILNLTSVQPDSATLMVKDKSYHAHHDFWEQSSMLEADKQKQGDFYRFQPDEMPYWDSYETVAVRGGPGSLFIWDSRTVHMNQPATADGIWRFVVYCCYQPRALATPTDLETKQDAYREYKVTTHWPAQNVTSLNLASSTQVEGAVMPDYKIVRTRDRVEDDRVLELAGMMPYGHVDTKTGLLFMSDEELAAAAAGSK
eukprot:jgi/Chrzof1/2694/Cz11g25140.t1